MKIISYEYHDPRDDGWQFSRITLRDVNLFVGETGAGKSRLLNTIFNLGLGICNNQKLQSGCWSVEFKIGSKSYIYELVTDSYGPENSTLVDYEKLIRKDVSGEEREIINRHGDSLIFNSLQLPKTTRNATAINTFKDEDDIAPVYEGFSTIMRRSFYGQDLVQSCAVSNVALEVNEDQFKNLKGLFHSNLPLNVRLFYLNKYHKKFYDQIIATFLEIFPFIESCQVMLNPKQIHTNVPGNLPVFAVKEKGVTNPIFLHELSSGIEKTLLILTDIITLPNGGIYIIDEYENSLGINAINFLPSFLGDFIGDNQVLITSHHPYLIGNMPMKNWYVFHRQGSKVTIKNGEEFEERYGSSKQQAYIKLINDPFYTEGVQ